MLNILYSAAENPVVKGAAETSYNWLDIVVFLVLILGVIAIGIYMSSEKKSVNGETNEKKGGSESYFLAGRGLGWWLIGFSLIAANISTEQFVGMSGSAARPVGLAIAGYEWLAAITLVVVAFFFLPKILKAGVFTIPELLEKRYGPTSRFLMSVVMVTTMIGVSVTGVIFSGAKVLEVFAGEVLTLTTACWLIGMVSAVYVLCGGLKACAWADLCHGATLIVGGAVILYLAFAALDNAPVEKIAATPAMAKDLEGKTAYQKFTTINAAKLHTVRPASDPTVPWTALVIGLWIPNFYYWGLNQYIMQRVLGSKSLAHGQGGVVFAACLKLLIPFIVVFPGIMALNLFKTDHLGYEINMQSEAKKGDNLYVPAIFEKVSSIDLPDFDTSLMEEKATGRRQFAEAAHIAENVAAGKMKIAFTFNEDFALLYPEDSTRIIEFNSQYLEDKSDIDSEKLKPEVVKAMEKDATELKTAVDMSLLPAKILAKQNSVIQGVIKKKNEAITGTGFSNMFYTIKWVFKGNTPEYIDVQKEMVGYDYDAAFPLLLRNLVGSGGAKGFVLAALMGAVMSALASMLNAASTIITMDIFKRYLTPKAPDKTLVFIGRVLVFVVVVIGCLIAPMLGHPKFGGIFNYIQEFQGFISPGILAIFLFGLFVKKAPNCCGVVGLIANPIIYGILKFQLPEVAFLDRMAITFGLIYLILLQLCVVFPRNENFEFKHETHVELKSSPLAKFIGVCVILVTIGLYIAFR